MTWIVVRGVVLTALVCVSLTLPAWAQGSLGAIAGVVTDESGAAMPGVTVTLSRVAIGSRGSWRGATR
jgi:hypothetical protein